MIVSDRRRTPHLHGLTPAEHRLLTVFAETGWSNASLAAHFGVTPRTIKTQMSSLLDKYGVKTRTQLALLVCRESA